jgi:hypothetical protein
LKRELTAMVLCQACSSELGEMMVWFSRNWELSNFEQRRNFWLKYWNRHVCWIERCFAARMIYEPLDAWIWIKCRNSNDNCSYVQGTATQPRRRGSILAVGKVRRKINKGLKPSPP